MSSADIRAESSSSPSNKPPGSVWRPSQENIPTPCCLIKMSTLWTNVKMLPETTDFISPVLVST